MIQEILGLLRGVVLLLFIGVACSRSEDLELLGEGSGIFVGIALGLGGYATINYCFDCILLAICGMERMSVSD